MVTHKKLTVDAIEDIEPPASGEKVLWDGQIAGFGVRCFPSGRKVYVLMYRPKSEGDRRPKRRMTLGDVRSVKLVVARANAMKFLGEVAAGQDPQAQKKETAKQDAARLDRALEAYDRHLKAQKVVHAEQILRNLRRYLPGPHDRIFLSELDRQTIAARIESIKDQSIVETKMVKTSRPKKGGKKRTATTVKRRVGGPGAAKDFRTKAHTFFNWAVNAGLMFANPLAGWRDPKKTRAQRIAAVGKALSDQEIKAVWCACDNVDAPFGDFVRILLLTGQRRTETSLMRWGDVDFGARVWTIPENVSKNGKQHTVALSAETARILSRQIERTGNPYVFAGRNATSAISNWSKRMAKFTDAAGVNFTLHDLRRTFRSGLSRLRISTEVAELMLNHRRADLIERYDREPRMEDRRDAAERWCDYIQGIIDQTETPANVIRIKA